MGGLNSRKEGIDERITELENTTIENNQSEQETGGKSFRDLWDYNKRLVILIVLFLLSLLSES